MALTEDRTFRIFRNATYIVNEDEIKLITEYHDNFLVSVNIKGVIKQARLNNELRSTMCTWSKKELHEKFWLGNHVEDLTGSLKITHLNYLKSKAVQRQQTHSRQHKQFVYVRTYIP